ncbi:molecular chaperone GrpE [Parabacteroides sp. PF5-5]|uniref:nucleotide exchange factor GrpE n=1 Tax=unclassified Parabacteroides TaxID=2649774 RepID=UPI002476CB54|nr:MULTISPECIES: nucleotide exchange factor GrpE [unclassified Parabacteroides]MDH6305562.1 molecular chaperone GrpE [Parabacteroides sp. PH5-39]MDH6316398.1 molecular chaperone GrpE [Parabacteroides sp. PF5-13]MDH6319883.1 molecular chaperone GrpE [Parabacteroides sp. PH5-13]MDH6323526.1 molecular chaperone GrpE [Parabacteroides sp. PH5-8]MDH6327585.1 molecular chaperone GrpE [Parabacteroides sp. PH5-41]
MSKENHNNNMEFNENDEFMGGEDATNLQDATEKTSGDSAEGDNVAESCDELQKKYDELNDSHLRLMAEFDNYRKRTLREKADLIKTGSESALINLLPVLDDFERALENIQKAENIEGVKEGVDLIYSKFMAYLTQQGVKPIESIGKPFETEMFEAVAIIPAPEEDLKGKVLDSIQTGYTLYDKVIRHAKVVVGE